MGRHCAGAQIITVSEPAGDDYQIDCRQGALAVPDQHGGRSRRGLERLGDVAFAVGAGKDDDDGLHEFVSLADAACLRWVSRRAIIFDKGIVRRSVIVALIVGTVLNLIAQGDFLIDGLALNWWKICLTYCVPYCVATYGACSARRA